jgi:hypothetical protein
LFAYRNDRRNLVFFHREHFAFDIWIAQVMANRLDEPADARAIHIDRVLHRQSGKVVGPVGKLAMKLFGQLAIANHDQPALYTRAILSLVGFV